MGAKPVGIDINEQNFVAAFSLVVIKLDLKSVPSRKKKNLLLFNNAHPYSFTVALAVSAMAQMHLTLKTNIIDNSITFSFDPDTAYSLLKRFYTGHLLHNPTTRTEAELKTALTVQITPKGTALLFKFCQSMGIKRLEMPEVVKSNLNTMALYEFDRSSSTNRILYSKYSNHILLSLMLGPKPHVWSADAKPAPLLNLYEKSRAEYEIEWENHILFSKAEGSPGVECNVSPIYHRYFTNPESDAHIQYFESESGVQVVKNKCIYAAGEKVILPYAFTGKSFVQWLCDCSTVYSPSEAMEIGLLMLHYELIASANDPGSLTFQNDRNAYYTLDPLKKGVCKWEMFATSEASHSTFLTQDREDFMKMLMDPGIRYLFRKHLEKERCSENIDAYSQLQEYRGCKRKLTQLLKHLTSCADEQRKTRLQSAADRMIHKCLLMASQIYGRYFTLDLAYKLNIDYGLQLEIDLVMALLKQGSSKVARMPESGCAYLNTPIPTDMKFEFSEKTLQPERPHQQISKQVITAGDLEHGEPLIGVEKIDNATLDSERIPSDYSQSDLGEELREQVAAIVRICAVFDKISGSIFRLMEVDSLPKFLQSEEYAAAMESMTPK